MKTDFGDYLRKIRNSKNISLRSLAAKLNISPAYLYDIEKGNRSPLKLEDLKKISLILKLTKSEQDSLYDCEGRTKEDIPSDIKSDIINNEDYLKLLREIKKLEKNDKIEVIQTIKKLVIKK